MTRIHNLENGFASINSKVDKILEIVEYIKENMNDTNVNGATVSSEDVNMSDQMSFPIASIDDLNVFEQLLKEKDFFQKMVRNNTNILICKHFILSLYS